MQQLRPRGPAGCKNIIPPTSDMQQAREVARSYLERGWAPVPVPHREKGPRLRGWPDLRATEADLPRLFGEPSNVGVLLGEPSGWLVDVDLDWPEARELAADFLPATGARFGRQGSPGSHWLYVVRGARTKKIEAPLTSKEEATICELRSTGAQTVFPGSVHPSGEAIRWELDGEPAVVDAEALEAALGRLAAAAMMKRRGAETPDDLPEPMARRVRELRGEASPEPALSLAAQLVTEVQSQRMPPPPSGLGWFEQVKARPVAEVARALGYEVEEIAGRRGRVRPCPNPACRKQTRRTDPRKDNRHPVEITSNRGRWECYGCKAEGSSLDFLAVVVVGTTSPHGPQWQEVRARAVELGLCTADAPTTPPTSPTSSTPLASRAPEPPGRPPADEVHALWEAALPISDDAEAAVWLRSRGLDPGAMEDRDLARVIPPGAECPSWAQWNKSTWAESGHRLIVPMRGPGGEIESLHARRIGDEHPKSLSPSLYRIGGLVMADALAQLWLAGDPAGVAMVRRCGLVIVEGVTDFLAMAAMWWSDGSEDAPAVVGVVDGSWSRPWGEALARLVPEDVKRVWILTDPDPGGREIEADILPTLRGRCRVGLRSAARKDRR